MLLEKFYIHSYHPYLFFNEDGSSITFVGFTVTELTGDVIDPVKNNEVIMKRAIKRDLYKGLQNNRVNFDENYYEWSKETMVEKIGMVMGIDEPMDPDPSYVLTPDNVIKILAIQMKFRSVTFKKGYSILFVTLSLSPMQSFTYTYRCNIPCCYYG